MENEVDKLEIVVEAEASRANRAMSALEKKIDRVAESLERCMLVAQGAVSLKGVNIDKLFSGPAMEKSAKTMGKKLANDLIKNFNLNSAGKDVEKQVKMLTGKISKGLASNSGNPYKGFSEDAEELGRIVAKNGRIAKSTADDYQRLYEWISKSGKIKLKPETAKSLGDSYKERSPILRQKMSTNGGTSMDEYYTRLQSKFPGILKETGNVENQFLQLDNALKHFYDTAKGYEKPKWMEEAAYDSVVEGLDDIATGIKQAKKESGDFEKSLKGIEDTGKSFSEMLGAGMDTSGLERAQKLVGDITRGSRTEGQKKTRSDLKYPVQPFAEINKKFKDSKLDTDYSSMGEKELQANIAKNERAYARVKQAISDMISLEGTDELGGKDWYNKILQMHQYENAVYDATEALGRLQANESDFSIERGEDTSVGDDFAEETEEIVQESVKAKDAVEELDNSISDVGSDTSGIDKANGKLDSIAKKAKSAFKSLTKDGLKGIPGNLTNGILDRFKLPETRNMESLNDTSGIDSVINRISDEIARVKNEIKDAFASGDSGKIDGVQESINDLKVLEKELKTYEQIRDSVYSGNAMPQINTSESNTALRVLKGTARGTFKVIGGLGRVAVAGIRGIPGALKSATSAVKKFGSALKSATKTAGKLMNPMKTLKGLMSGGGGNSGKMGMGNMIGSSIMFSTVFGAISQIKSAIKEGSDNLVQYSSEYNNSISGMVSSLLYLKNAWAAAFAPIINVVGPYISTFIDMIAGALNSVGQFAAALTGKGYAVQAKKAWSNYADSLDTTKKSADDASKSIKDLQNYTLGIDELNIIQPSSNSGSSGSGSSGDSSGPSPSDMFTTSTVDGGISDFAQKIKEAWKSADFTEIGGIVGQKLKDALDKIPWNGIQETAIKIGKSVGTFINGAVETQGLGATLGKTIGEAINTGIYGTNAFLDNTKWNEVGKFIGDGLNGTLNTIDFEAWGHHFAQKWNAVFATIGEAARTFEWSKLGTELANSVNTFIADFDWAENGARLGDLAKGLLDAIINFLEKTDWQELGSKLADFVASIDWTGVVIKLAEGIGATIGGLAGLLWGFIKDAWGDVVKWWKDTAFEDGKFTMEGLLNGIWEKLKDIGTWIKEHVFQPFIDGFKKAFGIHSPSTVMAEQGGYIMSGLLNGAIAKLQPVLDFFKNTKDSILGKFSKIDDWFKEKFESAREKTEINFSDIGKWFSARKDDIENSLKNLPSWMESKFKDGRKKTDNAFQNIGSWYANRKADIQKNMQSISSWFDSKFRNARSLTNSSFSNVGSWFGQRREDIKSNMRSISQWFNDIFKSAYNGITSIFDNVGDYFGKVAGWIKSPVLGAVKAIAKAVNWVYGKLGGDGDLIDISGLKNYANGTSGVAKDSFGIVNDQPGNMYRELVQFPNGKTVIPTGRNVVLPMPKGTKVMPAGQTAALMGMTGIKKYKSGIGNFFGNTIDKISSVANNVFQYIKDPEKLLEVAIDKFTDLTDAFEPGLSLAKSAVNSVFDTAVSKVKGFFDSFGAVDYKPSAGVEQWRGLAKQALMLTHQFSEANLNALLTQMMHESGGNPNAINNWDINAIRGIPSKGLMQVIDPTFHANAMAGYDTNIYDPLSNMIAAINYTVRRYGSLYNGWTARGYKGYKTGGMPINGEVYVANERGFGSEYIGSMGNRHVVANNQQITDGISQGVERANDETNALLRQVIENQEKILKKDTSTRLDSKKVNKQLSRGSRNSGYSFSTV